MIRLIDDLLEKILNHCHEWLPIARYVSKQWNELITNGSIETKCIWMSIHALNTLDWMKKAGINLYPDSFKWVLEKTLRDMDDFDTIFVRGLFLLVCESNHIDSIEGFVNDFSLNIKNLNLNDWILDSIETESVNENTIRFLMQNLYVFSQYYKRLTRCLIKGKRWGILLDQSLIDNWIIHNQITKYYDSIDRLDDLLNLLRLFDRSMNDGDGSQLYVLNENEYNQLIYTIVVKETDKRIDPTILDFLEKEYKINVRSICINNFDKRWSSVSSDWMFPPNVHLTNWWISNNSVIDLFDGNFPDYHNGVMTILRKQCEINQIDDPSFKDLKGDAILTKLKYFFDEIQQKIQMGEFIQSQKQLFNLFDFLLRMWDKSIWNWININCSSIFDQIPCMNDYERDVLFIIKYHGFCFRNIDAFEFFQSRSSDNFLIKVKQSNTIRLKFDSSESLTLFIHLTRNGFKVHFHPQLFLVGIANEMYQELDDLFGLINDVQVQSCLTEFCNDLKGNRQFVFKSFRQIDCILNKIRQLNHFDEFFCHTIKTILSVLIQSGTALDYRLIHDLNKKYQPTN